MFFQNSNGDGPIKVAHCKKKKNNKKKLWDELQLIKFINMNDK
jgi:hypothetical protein